MEVVNCFYNKYSINILAIVLAFFSVLIITKIMDWSIFRENTINATGINANLSIEEIENINNEVEYLDEEILKNRKWCLEIENIELFAEIHEGTTEEILDDFIGHFSSTPVNIGNVGLAAHNRGYKNNYFSRIKELKIGDKINYYINGNKFIYEVKEILIIYESDWSMLENTNDNRITLITCVENREKYRLCVQAVRVKEE